MAMLRPSVLIDPGNDVNLFFLFKGNLFGEKFSFPLDIDASPEEELPLWSEIVLAAEKSKIIFKSKP